jgi:hypothetical protein
MEQVFLEIITVITGWGVPRDLWIYHIHSIALLVPNPAPH